MARSYAAIPALLKARFNTNEILTSLMLVYIAQLFLDWLVRGAWRNPQGNNFPETRMSVPADALPAIWDGVRPRPLGFRLRHRRRHSRSGS